MMEKRMASLLPLSALLLLLLPHQAVPAQGTEGKDGNKVEEAKDKDVEGKGSSHEPT